MLITAGRRQGEFHPGWEEQECLTIASHGASLTTWRVSGGNHLITAVGGRIKIASHGASIDCMDYVGWELPYCCC